MKKLLGNTALGLTLVLGSALPLAAERIVAGLPGAPWNVQFAYFNYGEALGHFADEGITGIDYVSVSGSAVLLPQVANGQVHFGYANPDLTVIAASRGEPLPVRFVMNWLRSQTFEFVVLENSPLQSLEDLRGGKLGVGALTWGNLPLSRAMLGNLGIVWNQDVEVLPIGLGAAAWRRLQTGEVDAVNLFVGEHLQMEMAGIPLRRLPMPDQFRTIFSNGWVVGEGLIEQRPELIEGFGRALTRSWLACKENPEDCVRAYWAANPEAAPSAENEAAQLAIDLQRVMADVRQIDDFTVGGRGIYGDYPEDAWQRLVAVMLAEGQIENADFDLGLLFTNAFAEAYNDFEGAPVPAAAE